MILLEIDIVAINAGAALGGCVVGITEGALSERFSEKKSVRDLAANFSSNKIGKFAVKICMILYFIFV